MFTGLVPLISFQNFYFEFTAWPAVWHDRPRFTLAFDMPSSLSLIIASFWFKVIDVQLFLSLEPLKATVGLLLGPNFSIFVSQGIARPEERERDEEIVGWWSSQNKCTFIN